MTNHIGQSFLENSKQSRAQTLLKKLVANIGIDIATNPGAILEFVGLPLKGGGQAQVIKNPGAQLGGDAAHHLDR